MTNSKLVGKTIRRALHFNDICRKNNTRKMTTELITISMLQLIVIPASLQQKKNPFLPLVKPTRVTFSPFLVYK